MKALSLWQPWATAIAIGSKKIETRSWATQYRGPLAIHAAKRKNVDELLWLHAHWNWLGAMSRAGWGWGYGHETDIDRLPFGAIVATCQLVACRPTGTFTNAELDSKRQRPSEYGDLYCWTERQLGNFALGRFGWVLDDVRPLREPIPFRGAQGLFDVPDDMFAAAA